MNYQKPNHQSDKSKIKFTGYAFLVVTLLNDGLIHKNTNLIFVDAFYNILVSTVRITGFPLVWFFSMILFFGYILSLMGISNPWSASAFYILPNASKIRGGSAPLSQLFMKFRDS